MIYSLLVLLPFMQIQTNLTKKYSINKDFYNNQKYMREYKTTFTKGQFKQTAIPRSRWISHVISVQQGKSGPNKKEFSPAELQDHLLQENPAHKCKQGKIRRVSLFCLFIQPPKPFPYNTKIATLYR